MCDAFLRESVLWAENRPFSTVETAQPHLIDDERRESADSRQTLRKFQFTTPIHGDNLARMNGLLVIYHYPQGPDAKSDHRKEASNGKNAGFTNREGFAAGKLLARLVMVLQRTGASFDVRHFPATTAGKCLGPNDTWFRLRMQAVDLSFFQTLICGQPVGGFAASIFWSRSARRTY